MNHRLIWAAVYLGLSFLPTLVLAIEPSPGLDGLCDDVELDRQAGSFEQKRAAFYDSIL